MLAWQGFDGTVAISACCDGLAEQVFLSGQITDLQSRLNVMGLLNGDKIEPVMQLAFERLFDALGLPQDQLQRMLKNLQATQPGTASQGTPADMLLMPQRVSQLTWLGLTPQTLNQLQAHIALLPLHFSLFLDHINH